MFQNLFLYKVFKQNKFLFFVFSGYIFFSFYFNYTTVETTPFFAWGMFSAKDTIPKTHKIIEVKYNNGITLKMPHTFEEQKSMMVYFTINYYKTILENNRKDLLQNNLNDHLYIKYPFIKSFGHKLVCTENDLQGYLPWFKRYLQSITTEPITNINIYENEIQYNINRHVELVHSNLLYSIK